MANNKGKAFEAKFKKDFLLTMPNSTIDRLYDSTSGYKTISNISDFIGYSYPNIYYLECKSHLGNTWNFVNFTQYDKLKEKVGIPGVRAGVVLWMIDHDQVVYMPVSTVTKMKEDGYKSYNVKMVADKTYNIREIPSVKRRVFLDSDYSSLTQLKDGE
jgi:hypothetical protein